MSRYHTFAAKTKGNVKDSLPNLHKPTGAAVDIRDGNEVMLELVNDVELVVKNAAGLHAQDLAVAYKRQ